MSHQTIGTVAFPPFGDVPKTGTQLPNIGMSAKHEISAKRLEVLNLALGFVEDCASFEGYGHALPDEVRKRAARLMAMLRP